MTPHFDFSEVPYSFGLCAAENCPKASTCLRRIAMQYAPVNRIFLPTMNPNRIIAGKGKCDYCSVLNKLTLLTLEIHMEALKKKYTPYTESERMSYIREYLSTSETKYQFAKRTGICRRLLILWLDKYHINDKVMSTEQPSLRKDSDESLNELEKELAALRAENRKLQRALQEESLRHEACEELINLAESTYHIKVRKNSDAK